MTRFLRMRTYLQDLQAMQAGSYTLLRLYGISRSSGLDPLLFIATIVSIPRFLKTMLTYLRARDGGKFPLRISCLYPILTGWLGVAGTAKGHYFHQDLWAARKILKVRPKQHIDIGSRIDGFVAHILTFMPVTVIDIRQLDSDILGLTFVQGDATNLSGFADNSVESLSSLHAVEHFGLGRYGDPIDPNACFKAMREMARVLRPGGRLYFSVPIGIERLEFNAHRVFSPKTILDTFRELDFVSFAAVDDAGDFRDCVEPDDFINANHACGLFEFTKKGRQDRYV